MTTSSRLRAALLGSGAVLALMAGPALAGETEDLKAQIEQLQSRLDSLEKQQGATDAKVDAKQAAPADAVVGGDFPGSFKLPGSDTSMAIHGYTKLDVLVDINQAAGDSFDVTGIAPNGSVAERRGGPQFRLHARQSRITFETRTPTNYGQLTTFIQGDFFGTGGSQTVSNSTSFRIRHAYGTLGPVLTGQTWTNFGNIDDDPETLDFQGPAGQIFARQGQVRYTQPLGKFTVSGSIENPSSQDVTTNTGATGSAAIPTPGDNAAHAINRMPDVTAKGVYTDTWGHVAVSAIGRYFETDNGGGDPSQAFPSRTSSQFGGGGHVSGTINIGTLIPFAPISTDQVGFNGFYGSGIARYVGEGNGQPQSAVIKNFAFGVVPPGTPAVRLETQATWGGFLWYLHNWTDTLRSSFVGGVQLNHWSDAVPNPGNSTLTDRVITGHANLIWSPIKSVNLGVEYMWGERDFHQSPFATSGIFGPTSQKAGNDNRVQFSAQYLF